MRPESAASSALSSIPRTASGCPRSCLLRGGVPLLDLGFDQGLDLCERKRAVERKPQRRGPIPVLLEALGVVRRVQGDVFFRAAKVDEPRRVEVADDPVADPFLRLRRYVFDCGPQLPEVRLSVFRLRR